MGVLTKPHASKFGFRKFKKNKTEKDLIGPDSYRNKQNLEELNDQCNELE